MTEISETKIIKMDGYIISADDRYEGHILWNAEDQVLAILHSGDSSINNFQYAQILSAKSRRCFKVTEIEPGHYVQDSIEPSQIIVARPGCTLIKNWMQSRGVMSSLADQRLVELVQTHKVSETSEVHEVRVIAWSEVTQLITV